MSEQAFTPSLAVQGQAAHGPTEDLRQEDLESVRRLREAFDVAVCRALAPMPVLAELCLPFVRVGGRLLLGWQ